MLMGLPAYEKPLRPPREEPGQIGEEGLIAHVELDSLPRDAVDGEQQDEDAHRPLEERGRAGEQGQHAHGARPAAPAPRKGMRRLSDGGGNAAPRSRESPFRMRFGSERVRHGIAPPR